MDALLAFFRFLKGSNIDKQQEKKKLWYWHESSFVREVTTPAIQSMPFTMFTTAEAMFNPICCIPLLLIDLSVLLVGCYCSWLTSGSLLLGDETQVPDPLFSIM